MSRENEDQKMEETNFERRQEGEGNSHPDPQKGGNYCDISGQNNSNADHVRIVSSRNKEGDSKKSEKDHKTDTSKQKRRQKGDSPPDILQVEDVPTRAWFVLGASLPIFIVIVWYFWTPYVFIPAAKLFQKIYYFCYALSMAATSPCPNWIWPDELKVVNITDGLDIQRYDDIDREMFLSLMDKGEPFVLSGIMKDWSAFEKYNCDYFIQNYPDAEYHDWQAGEQVPIGDIPKRPGYKGYECAAGYLSMDMWESSRKYTLEWLSQLETPSFMTDFFDFKTMRSDVTGFIGTMHTGVSPHLDEMCSSLATLQFSGVKYWSVSRPVIEGGKLVWSKPYTFKVYPGDIMIWFMGQRHHTEIVEGCSFSLSFQIDKPAPMTYFKDLQQTIAKAGMEESDKFFDDIGAAEVRYIYGCEVVNEGADSFVTQNVNPSNIVSSEEATLGK
ncbi:uncharacterized protein LOC135499618 [Lineus longissimus]|uniref:uncharacterized protein LOC135499618 n=1 Tax=Lineus longissimus TaxID=88925 RepID=UPI00315CEA7A